MPVEWTAGVRLILFVWMKDRTLSHQRHVRISSIRCCPLRFGIKRSMKTDPAAFPISSNQQRNPFDLDTSAAVPDNT